MFFMSASSTIFFCIPLSHFLLPNTSTVCHLCIILSLISLHTLRLAIFLSFPDFGQADFKRGVVSMSDLRVGAVLTGRVDNTALFGAFVDIGVGRAGLIHKSNITLDKLPVSQRCRSLALGPGERVEVRVLNVDLQRGRIGLDLIRVLQ